MTKTTKYYRYIVDDEPPIYEFDSGAVIYGLTSLLDYPEPDLKRIAIELVELTDEERAKVDP